MNVGKAIYYLLSNAESVTNIAGTRIYPELAEQEAVAPYAVYQIVSVNPDDTNDGPAVIDEVVVDVLCVAESYNEAADLATAVRASLDRVRGTYNGVNVESIQYDSTDSDVQDSPRRYEQTVTLTVRVFRDAAQIATGQNIDQLTLGRLYDVTDDATTGQVIIKQADGTWAGGDAAGALGDLTDVASDVTSEAIDRHALVYDEDSGEWITRYPGEIRIYNDSDETIVKGRCVTAIGAQGDMVTVRPYITTDDTRYVVGVATEEMAVGASGHAITIGEVRGLDTEGFAVGTILQPTNFVNSVRPFGMGPATAGAGQPDRPLPIAMVTRSHANTGRIQVRMFTPGYYHQIAAMSDVYVPFPYQGATLKYIVTGGNAFWGYLPQTSKIIADGAEEDVEIYYYAESDDTQLAITQRSDTPSAGNKIVRKIWYATSSQADPDADVWTLYQTLADNATFTELKAAFEASLLVSPTGGQPVSIKTTWEDIPAFTGLLDDYPGAAAAYSLRLLDSTYTGDAINVRRASDNAVQDIGFDANGDLDTSALATFCAGTDGFVVRWYDQSGGGIDLTQSTTAYQPKIVQSGSVITRNAKPVVRGVNNNTALTNETKNLSDFFSASGHSTIQALYSSQDAFLIQGALGSSNRINCIANNGTSTSYVYFDSGNISSGGRLAGGVGTVSHQIAAHIRSNNSGLVYRNGSQILSGTFSDSPDAEATVITIKFKNTALEIHELIHWSSDQSSNRTGIETNINDYYTIY